MAAFAKTGRSRKCLRASLASKVVRAEKADGRLGSHLAEIIENK
jgi:hypothetical protein